MTPILPKSSSKENKSNATGQANTKNNSSKKIQEIINAVLFPASTPSLLRNKTMRLPPPTAEGVTAEVNSQSMFTLKP